MDTAPADYQAAISGRPVVFERPTALVTLTGPDAAQFLHNICTNDIKGLSVGGGCEAYLCNAQARALFVLWVYRRGDHELYVSTTPGRADALLQHLDRFLIAEQVELADVSARFTHLHEVNPPEATPDNPRAFREFQGNDCQTDGTDYVCRRHDVLGVIGYDFFIPQQDGGSADTVRQALARYDGAVTGTVETYELLRVEAGTPVYGVDIDESRFVMEIGNAARAVSYAKGCFPGQEPIVMARDRAGRVNRSFLGLKGLDGRPIPVGAKLTRDGAEVGVVTSATDSPRLGGPLALGYVHWKHTAPGTRLEAAGVPVEVLGYPPLAPVTQP